MKRVMITGILILMVIGAVAAVSGHMEELPVIRNNDISDLQMNIVDGSVGFYIHVDFDTNRFFSRYDVKMLLDGRELATIDHGQTYEGMFGVSEGFHTLAFVNEDNPAVQGSTRLKIDRDSAYSCAIHTNWRSVTIRDEFLNLSAVDHEALELEQFIGECEHLDYETVNRFPEQTKGEKVRIKGRVTKAVEIPLVGISLMSVAEGNNTWLVSCSRTPSDGRILPGDVIVVYGECRGLSNCFIGSGLLLGDWTTAVPAIASRHVVRNR